ncbi:MAG: maleylpyruvate isomerase family mycothiol-dependent enzyme, partial [Sporichthyaceae bacterium]
REQVAHVLALELQLGGQPLPPRLDSYPPHVRGPSGEHMENGIAALGDVSPADLVQRLGVAVDEHLEQLRAVDLGPEATVEGTLGKPVPLARFLPIRVFDVWTHEQDVRRAIGAQPGPDGPAAEMSRQQVLGALPYLVGKQAAAPVGSSVAFDAPGPLGGRVTVTVGDDGRATATDGVVADATVTLRMTDSTMMRLACGRLAVDDADVEVVGDEELGRRVLGALTLTP